MVNLICDMWRRILLLFDTKLCEVLEASALSVCRHLDGFFSKMTMSNIVRAIRVVENCHQLVMRIRKLSDTNRVEFYLLDGQSMDKSSMTRLVAEGEKTFREAQGWSEYLMQLHDMPRGMDLGEMRPTLFAMEACAKERLDAKFEFLLTVYPLTTVHIPEGSTLKTEVTVTDFSEACKRMPLGELVEKYFPVELIGGEHRVRTWRKSDYAA
jgi:hypothetical protein